MLRAYEAVYRKGRLDWVAMPPDLADGARLLVVVEEEKRSVVEERERREVLDAAWGAWGTRKTPDEVDEELRALRAEWDRGWEAPRR